MLEVAWMVFNNREKEKEMQQAQRGNLREGRTLEELIEEGEAQERVIEEGEEMGEWENHLLLYSPILRSMCNLQRKETLEKGMSSSGNLDPALQAIKLMTLNDES
ncbi:LOW QUALITY PROTEIN: hypothetical protein QYF61_014992 [Mycteria americana]|uniref:Uncharacterized protein n=1 Tax=Mycteria americana TaxID=33587 RepID=A0AAN7NS80_MYCAM|nr:LOW QUALITY PROTEIN: hypothetical protein QYF61_014992 [Mycteria americana]